MDEKICHGRHQSMTGRHTKPILRSNLVRFILDRRISEGIEFRHESDRVRLHFRESIANGRRVGAT